MTQEKRTVYWIEGDGIGREVWQAARPVIDTAIAKTYGNTKALVWSELLAAKKRKKKQALLYQRLH